MDFVFWGILVVWQISGKWQIQEKQTDIMNTYNNKKNDLFIEYSLTRSHKAIVTSLSMWFGLRISQTRSGTLISAKQKLCQIPFVSAKEANC